MSIFFRLTAATIAARYLNQLGPQADEISLLARDEVLRFYLIQYSKFDLSCPEYKAITAIYSDQGEWKGTRLGTSD